MKRGLISFIAVCMALAGICLQGVARKVVTKRPKAKRTEAQVDTARYVAGSFMVASDCKTCNNGYSISQVKLYSFDKASSSDWETFFVENNTDRVMTGLSVYIIYKSMDGKQFHKRFVAFEDLYIPAGETRQVSTRSFDKQHSFYYHESSAGRSGARPFKVAIDPVAVYLRY